MPPDSAEPAPKRSKDEQQSILMEALKRFHISEDAEADIRREFIAQMKFTFQGEQWPGAIETDRQLNGRPSLTINKTEPAIRQVTNDMRQNRPQVKVSPTDDKTEDVAEVLEGMVRHIQVASNADIAIDTAAENQVGGGFGYMRVLTEYVGDDSFDQEIRIKQIKNPLTVFADPLCMEPDYSDARYYFIITDIAKDEFKRLYPKAEASNAFMSSEGDDLTRSWISEETIRIAEYWRVELSDSKLHELHDGTLIQDDHYNDLVKGAEGQQIGGQPVQIPGIKRSRPLTKRTVKCFKITAFDVLEEYEWPGKYIPIIPVLGKDVEIDGKRFMRGLTWNMMDPQRQYNYWTSAATEAIALAPKAPWLVAEGQVEGYEQIWQNSNRGSPSYLPYKPITINGNLAPQPERNTSEPPISAMAEAIAQASQNLKETSGIYDASLGNQGNETSGKAILARQKQGDVANFNFSDNLTRSLRFLGVVLLDLIPKIYDTKRIVRIVHEDQTHETVQINAPAQAGAAAQDPAQKAVDVTVGRYDVVMETGPSYNTKRQEAAQSMLGVSQAYPELWDKAGDLLVKNLDWPGASDLANRLKAFLPAGIAQEDETNIPPQVAAKLQQSGQMIEQLTQAVHALKDQLDSKDKELESKERIAAMNNETQVVITEMKANYSALTEELQHVRAGFDQMMKVGAFQHQVQQAQVQNDMAQQQMEQAAQQPQQPQGGA